MLTEAQQDELYALLERADEIAYTDGVDSEEYQEAYAALLAKQAEYGVSEEISEGP